MEQPLPPEDLAGMRLLCERSPVRLEIADGDAERYRQKI
jgi:L-alanine-DL-glutamate epimerase-like enolase superfamily enzyme